MDRPLSLENPPEATLITRVDLVVDGLHVLLELPVAGALGHRRVPVGLGVAAAALAVEQLDGPHVLVLAADVLPEDERRDDRPDARAAEHAGLDDAELALRVEVPGADGAHGAVDQPADRAHRC